MKTRIALIIITLFLISSAVTYSQTTLTDSRPATAEPAGCDRDMGAPEQQWSDDNTDATILQWPVGSSSAEGMPDLWGYTPGGVAVDRSP